MEGKTIKDDSIFSASVTGCLARLHQRPKFEDCSTPRSSALLASLQAQMFIQVSKKKKILFLSQRHTEMCRAETSS